MMDKNTVVTYCQEKNCFNTTLTYPVTSTNIKSLIETSMECYQDITFHCKSSKITKYASFTDLSGDYHKFFSNHEKNICQCSENNSCFEIPEIAITSCNCDHGDPVERQDKIKITKKVKIEIIN